MPVERQASLLEQIKGRARAEHAPLHALIEITDACNLHCRHCYVSDPSTAGILSLAQVKTVLDQLAEAGVLFLTLSGGEPLVRTDFFDILTNARAKDFSVALFTNATLVTPEVADRLAALALQRAEISILGATASTHDRMTGIAGSYALAVRGARLLAERGVTVQIKTTLTRINIAEAEDIRALADSMGATYRAAGLIIHARDGSTRDDLLPTPEQLHALRQAHLDRAPAGAQVPGADAPAPSAEEAREIIPCGLGQSSVRIDARGNVTPCVAVNVSIGNILQTPFSRIWTESPELKRMRTIRLADLPECNGCELWSRCGRCAGMAMMETGDLKGKSPQACFLARELQDFIEEKRCELH